MGELVNPKEPNTQQRDGTSARRGTRLWTVRAAVSRSGWPDHVFFHCIPPPTRSEETAAGRVTCLPSTTYTPSTRPPNSPPAFLLSNPDWIPEFPTRPSYPNHCNIRGHLLSFRCGLHVLQLEGLCGRVNVATCGSFSCVSACCLFGTGRVGKTICARGIHCQKVKC